MIINSRDRMMVCLLRGSPTSHEVSNVPVDTLLYYDQPEYDEFWQMVTDLDVPVYFHPRTNVEPILSLVYGHGFGLEGPAQEFAATLSTHILGLCTNGIFE